MMWKVVRTWKRPYTLDAKAGQTQWESDQRQKMDREAEEAKLAMERAGSVARVRRDGLVLELQQGLKWEIKASALFPVERRYEIQEWIRKARSLYPRSVQVRQFPRNVSAGGAAWRMIACVAREKVPARQTLHESPGATSRVPQA